MHVTLNPLYRVQTDPDVVVGGADGARSVLLARPGGARSGAGAGAPPHSRQARGGLRESNLCPFITQH